MINPAQFMAGVTSLGVGFYATNEMQNYLAPRLFLEGFGCVLSGEVNEGRAILELTNVITSPVATLVSTIALAVLVKPVVVSCGAFSAEALKNVATRLFT